MCRRLLTALAFLLLFDGAAQAQPARAVVPLAHWQRLRAALDVAPAEDPPPAQWAGTGRTLEGSLDRGLLEATLTMGFEVLEGAGWTEVPVLDARASLVDARLDGARAALRREGEHYVLGLDAVGPHTLTVRFLLGQTEDRFARALRLKLPAAGPTRLGLTIAEPDIEATVAHGVLTAHRPVAGGTRVEGAVDGADELALTWRSQRGDAVEGPAVIEVEQATLFTVQAALLTGVSQLQVNVAEGSTRRLQIPLPKGVEVVRVEGPRVLQWQADAEAGELTLLLTHLVREAFAVAIHFQAPTDPGGAIHLRGPGAPAGARFEGVAGVQAPAGLDVRVVTHPGAQMLDLRSLPEPLLALTDSPLLFGFRHERPIDVTLALSRNAPVALAGTLVDEIEASTVLLEDGAEITKVKLHLRNNTRQHLGLTLPDGARLTHALIDGRPTRPAVEGDGLLFPLRQSERLDGEGRFHRVRPGENLGGIAYTYYSNPERWPLIAAANADELGGGSEVYEGLRLRIPPLPGAEVEESRFILEVAFERDHPALGLWGRADVRLPALDVEAVKATWHVYLPRAIAPLHFEANLRQYSAIRYDPFRRARDFLEVALVSRAEAGSAKYKSILSRRRGIYLADAAASREARAALGSFPLVGERYRFKRLLVGSDTPAVAITYLATSVALPVRLGASLLAALLAVLALARGRRPWIRRLAALALSVPLLALGHLVLGVNRHLVWGVDLGLLWLLAHTLAPRWRAALRGASGGGGALGWATPATLFAALGVLVALTVMVTFPLLSPLGALFGLSALWLRARRAEATHA